MIVEIEPFGLGAELEETAALGCGPDDAFDVDVDPCAAAQQAAGRVHQDGETAMVDCTQHALGLFCGRQVEAQVNRADDQVELRQDGIRVIQAAVGKDVDFGTF